MACAKNARVNESLVNQFKIAFIFLLGLFLSLYLLAIRQHLSFFMQWRSNILSVANVFQRTKNKNWFEWYYIISESVCVKLNIFNKIRINCIYSTDVCFFLLCGFNSSTHLLCNSLIYVFPMWTCHASWLCFGGMQVMK